MKKLIIAALTALLTLVPFAAAEQFGRQQSSSGIKHSFLIAGPITALVGEDGEVKWQTKGRSRDAYMLENGNVLTTIANTAKEITREGKVEWSYKLAPENKELGTAVRLVNGNTLEELGGREAENWPFTAIRLKNGGTLVNLTHGNKTAEFDSDGKVVWKVTNKDVAGRFADPCGGQRLANGNTVICSYAQTDAEKPKLFEITPDKKVVWEFFHPKARAHEVHILTTNGKKEGYLK